MKNLIIKAIENSKLIEFYYNDHYRVVEPHTFGIFGNGNELLVAFQVDGTSDTGKVPEWKRFSFSKIEKLNVLNEDFVGTRDGYKKGDTSFKIIYSDL